jgi:hypothetical protein
MFGVNARCGPQSTLAKPLTLSVGPIYLVWTTVHASKTHLAGRIRAVAVGVNGER